MIQYLNLLQHIMDNGVTKESGRPNMPNTKSVFGYQMRFNLQEGFPLLTTKKMYWKGIVIELLWFLRGDTNIKYLLDNGVNIWNEDAYAYYCKSFEKLKNQEYKLTFQEFIVQIKSGGFDKVGGLKDYTLGDCGYQYGKVWRNWETGVEELVKNGQHYPSGEFMYDEVKVTIDQIKNVIESLKKNPYSRRHLVTAIDPTHENDLALYWCHSLFQMNCRKISTIERMILWESTRLQLAIEPDNQNDEWLDIQNVPKYFLDCQLYQRSCDTFLGVPFNIASYSLLVHIIGKICNMVPGEFIWTGGDVHIYDNHFEQVKEQLGRTPKQLPKLQLTDMVKWKEVLEPDFDYKLIQDGLENYDFYPSLKAELSTGIVK